MSEGEDAGEPYGTILRVYRDAKWATLRDEGPTPLRRELAKLERFLEQADEPHVQRMNIDEGFRRAKARVLREILSEAHEEG